MNRAVTAQTTEERLVERARDGDLSAFEALYRSHVGRTHALALRMTGDAREAEEATQDIWVRTWERLDSFHGESAFTTWLHRLSVNSLLDRQRRRSRLRNRGESLEHPEARRQSRSPDRTGDRIDLERALAELPEGARTMFTLHQIEGFKCREIAELTGRAEGTVKAQLHRARTLLKEALA